MRLALGAAAALAAHLLLPAAAPSPALRATLVALPLVVALFESLRRALGARPAGAAERLLAAAWVAAALHGSRLGFAGLEPALVAALALAVAARVAGLVPALARRVARRREQAWRPVAALAFVAGLALLPAVDRRAEPFGDEPYFLLLAESLSSDGDVDLADEYRDGVSRRFLGRDLGPQPGDPVGAGGELYSRHESLLTILLAPFWAAAGTFGARLAMLALWSLAAGATLRLAFACGLPPRGALVAALGGAFAPPFLLYAHALWVDAPAALAVAVALELVLRARSRAGSGASLSARELALLAAVLAALPLLKPRLIAVALPIALLAAAGRGGGARWRTRLVALAAVAAIAAFVLVRNLATVGRALRVYDADDLALFATPLARYLVGADGLIFDVAFGLLAWGPIWLLALPGVAAALVRVRGYALAAATLVPYLALVVSRREWYGGWSPPFRYGLVALPLLAIGFAALVAPRRNRALRAAAAALGATSGLAALASFVEPGWVASFADGRSRLLDLGSAPFAADFARFLPSAVRWRTASWLAPLVALAALVLVARPAGRRVRSRAAVPLGVAALLAAAAGLVVAAHRLPTRVVELEDPWIPKRAGALYPSRWTFDRTRFDGGWTLPPGTQVAVAPVAGGTRVAVRLRCRALASGNRPVGLELEAGGVGRGAWRLAPGAEWSWLESEPFDWPADGRIRLAVRELDADTARSGAVVDKLELDWR